MSIFAVRGGIPNVAYTSSPDPNYYPLSKDLKSNIGYIGLCARGWKFYTSQGHILKDYHHLCESNKYYFYGSTLEECIKNAEKITGHKVIVIDVSEIEEYKKKLKTNDEFFPHSEYYDDSDIFYFSHELDNLIGLKEVKQEIHGLRSFAKIRAKKMELGIPVTPSTLHMVFTGNPGTGKTTVARLIGKIYHEIGLLPHGTFLEVSRSDLVGNHIGSTAILTANVFKKALGGVLFIDEAYSLYKNESKDFGMEAIETLVKLMEDFRDNTVVIIAGYTKEINALLKSNPGLKSRFSTYLHFSDFSKDELLLILKKMISDIGHTITNKALLKMDFLIDDDYDSGKFIGNARSMRNIFDIIQKRQASRLEKIVNPSKEELINFLDVDIPEHL